MKATIAAVAALATFALPTAANANANTWHSNEFLSPSGNISCSYQYTEIACVTFNNGRGVYVSRYGGARRFFGTAGFRHQAPRLPYNLYWSWQGFECDSSVSGMQCMNPSGRGFTIAREGISTF